MSSELGRFSSASCSAVGGIRVSTASFAYKGAYLDIVLSLSVQESTSFEDAIKGLGLIAKGVGELILAVLAQVADMDRNRIRENTAAGRARAIELLATTGRTQHGKKSMGRPSAQAPEVVRQWRVSNRATIAATAQHFGISTATVKRYFAASEGN